MKKIWTLYKRDIRKVVTNWVALSIIIGLMILPSLYAWFNIKASWDPYGNTKGIKVAVTNHDDGTILKDADINIGKQMIDKLKSNDKIGWCFVSEDEGKSGVKSGKYYASVLIPKDFSTRISSILTGDLKRPELIYSVNEKVNAIAPKITDKGISTLQSEVNKAFIQASSEAVFVVLKQTSTKLKDNKPQIDKFINILSDVDSNMDNFTNSIDGFYNGATSIEETIKHLQSTLPIFSDLVNKSSDISSKSQDLILKSKESMSNIKSLIREQLVAVDNLSKTIDANIKAAIAEINTNKTNSSESLQKAKNNCNSLLHIISNTKEVLITFNSKHNVHAINNLIQPLDRVQTCITNLSNLLSKTIDTLNSNAIVPQDKLIELTNTSSEINNNIKNSLNIYDSTVSNEINTVTNNIYDGLNNTIKILQNTSAILPNVNNVLSSLSNGTFHGSEGLKSAKETLVNAKSIIHTTVTDLKGLSSEDKFNKVFDLLKANAKEESEFLSSPVDIKTDKIYHIPNYGSAMTPFYTVLALWVGALLLVSLLSTHVHEDEELKNLKSYEIYFSRYLTFLTIALVQAVIVSLGDLFLLKIYCINKILFIFIAMYCSFIFSMMIYTLVSTFGDLGKAMSVVLLVLQVSASGGTFPIEVTPPFFRAINPLLPFTYSIGAMRECVGGVYKPALIQDLLILLIYLFISLFIGLFLKKRLAKANEFLEEKMEETGLM